LNIKLGNGGGGRRGEAWYFARRMQDWGDTITESSKKVLGQKKGMKKEPDRREHKISTAVDGIKRQKVLINFHRLSSRRIKFWGGGRL